MRRGRGKSFGFIRCVGVWVVGGCLIRWQWGRLGRGGGGWGRARWCLGLRDSWGGGGEKGGRWVCVSLTAGQEGEVPLVRSCSQ